MLSLLELVRRFRTEFTLRKRERAAVDFADQEQLALELFGRGDAAGTGPAAAAERARYELVRVDECQDLNAAQDAMLRSISRSDVANCGNRFLVGDVKQSIYRFREADPAIFQRYAAAWSQDGAGASQDQVGNGRVLTLTDTFNPDVADYLIDKLGDVLLHAPEAATH